MNIRFGTLSLIAILTLGTLLSATTVIPMSVEELTSAATHIVRAHAIDSHSAWNDQHSAIYTYTRFQIDETIKGSPDAVITVKQLGGSAGGYTLHVAGVHPWSNAESAVLFLRVSEEHDGTFSIVGLMQGDFRLRRSGTGEMTADNGLQASARMYMSPAGDVHAYSPATNQLTAYSGSRLTLTELESRVRTAIAGGKNLQ
jgi:hypothetical protein